MRTCIILAQHKATAAALEAFWELVQPSGDEPNLANGDSPLKPYKIVLTNGVSDTLGIYNNFVRQIRAHLDQRKIPPAKGFVLVDHVSLTGLNPVSGQGCSQAIGMLILTFPELRWISGIVGKDQRAEEVFDGLPAFELASLFEPDNDALFDFSGLRDFIRLSITKHKENDSEIAPSVPRRCEFSVAIDDEAAYAYFHAYAAYRFGFRSLPILTEQVALARLESLNSKPTPMLAFEDVFIDFPDKTDSDSHYSDLANFRDGKLKALRRANHRVFVTTGQRHAGDEAKRLSNRTYINSRPASGQCRQQIYKPLRGLFDLWEETRLNRRLNWSDNGRTYHGTAKGFIWPPLKQQTTGDTGHSAPGRLLVVAQNLIERCNLLLKEGVSSVPEAVQGAVFATNALELLSDRTPTTGIEALSLKHQFEVLAECQFSGVEYHLRIHPRISEIQNEIAAIGRWFARKKRKEAMLNAEMKIINSLVRILREYNQFDEEQICMNRVRHLHNSLWMRQKPWRFMMWPIVRYIELLLGSFSGFIAIIFLWVAVLSGLYTWAISLDVTNFPDLPRWTQGLAASISSFFSVGGPIHHGPGELAGKAEYVSVICLAIVMGFVHLGVFISHLYTLVSRR